jgi:hypothetical protein
MLTHDNYDQWKQNMIVILAAMKAYAIVSWDNPEQQSLDFDHNSNDDDWKPKHSEAASVIRLYCSPDVRHIINSILHSHKMWNTLETNLESMGSHIGRGDTLREFRACRPKKDKPLKMYLAKLSISRIQLDHADDAVTDRDFRMQKSTSLPSLSTMILMVLKHRQP